MLCALCHAWTDFGSLTCWCGLLHSLFHIVRVVYDGQASTLWWFQAHRSGLVAAFFLLPTALPMMMTSLKRRVSTVRLSMFTAYLLHALDTVASL